MKNDDWWGHWCLWGSGGGYLERDTDRNRLDLLADTWGDKRVAELIIISAHMNALRDFPGARIDQVEALADSLGAEEIGTLLGEWES